MSIQPQALWSADCGPPLPPQARKKHGLAESVEPAESQIAEAQKEMAFEASRIFENPKLRDFVENARKAHEQIIDIVNLDKVISAGFDGQVKEQATKTVKEFKTYIAENRDAITALNIFYSQPYRRRELTYQMINELCETIKQNKPRLAPFSVWHAYEQLEKVNGNRPENELVALVSLIRRVLEIDTALTPYDSVVNRNFQAWVMDRHKGNAPKFSEEQMQWLRMIKDHIATSMHMTRADFDFNPFAELGGLGKAWQVFGERLDKILEELNEGLAA